VSYERHTKCQESSPSSRPLAMRNGSRKGERGREREREREGEGGRGREEIEEECRECGGGSGRRKPAWRRGRGVMLQE